MSAPVDDWRGVAAEDIDDVTTSTAGLLRARSRRLLGSLLRPHRRGVLAATSLIVVETASSLTGPLLVKLGIDRGIPPLQHGGGAGVLVAVVLAYAASSVVAAASYRGFQRVAGRVGQEVLLDLRIRLFDHFQQLSLAFHERYTSGRVISRLTSDVDAISDLLETGLVTLVSSALQLVGIAVFLLALDRPLGGVVLLSVPVLYGFTVWFRHHSAQAYRAGRTAVVLVIVHFVESLGGIRVVQAFRREQRNAEIMGDFNGRYTAANAWSMRLTGLYGPGLRAVGACTTAVVLLYGGNRVLDRSMTVGVLVAFLLYLRRFFEPLQDLSQFYNLFQAAAAALEKLSGVLEEEPDVAPPAAPVALPEPRGEVRFEDVTFRYRPDLPPVLADLDLVLPAGQTVALVGETGAGKSTIARLLSRFYDPTEGRVLLDGVDLRSLEDAALRRAVVMVTQENFLFTGTVADNIAFGRPTATREEIEAAARTLGAHEFITALPEGYDTDVRKRGGRLSAGQRQLVAFARAFLADPAVLVLDEATSSLDIPSERLVQRALRTLLAERTAVIIAHRLTTVEIADRVLVIDDGRIVEDGSPADLTGGSGHYAALQAAWADSLV